MTRSAGCRIWFLILTLGNINSKTIEQYVIRHLEGMFANDDWISVGFPAVEGDMPA